MSKTANINSAIMKKKHGKTLEKVLIRTVLTEREWLEAQQRGKQQLKAGVEWLNSAFNKSFYE